MRTFRKAVGRAAGARHSCRFTVAVAGSSTSHRFRPVPTSETNRHGYHATGKHELPGNRRLYGHSGTNSDVRCGRLLDNVSAFWRRLNRGGRYLLHRPRIRSLIESCLHPVHPYGGLSTADIQSCHPGWSSQLSQLEYHSDQSQKYFCRASPGQRICQMRQCL
ncbi:MAG: hypothetical protein JWO95_508 [Verrucomicrobiales bacterium]|nr:hypothetical protein [Verrucomicrobiales bacterium]